MREKPGCLVGLGKLAILNWLFGWMQNRFGFGRRGSIFSCGCGIILVIIFAIATCSVITGTDWTSFF